MYAFVESEREAWHFSAEGHFKEFHCHLLDNNIKFMLEGGKCEERKLLTVKIALDTQHVLFTSSCVLRTFTSNGIEGEK
jgi:hypothetical protein